MNDNKEEKEMCNYWKEIEHYYLKYISLFYFKSKISISKIISIINVKYTRGNYYALICYPRS